MTSQDPHIDSSVTPRSAAARRSPTAYAFTGVMAVAVAFGCNAVLGIEEATLCGGEICDGGATAIESAQPSSPSAAGSGATASDAGAPAPPRTGELGMPTELDPGVGGASNSGSDNSDPPGSETSGSETSGNDNSGSGNSNSGNGNSGQGNGNSGPGEGPPPGQAPASACDGRNGESFCMGSTRINCGADGTPSSFVPCLSEAHCALGTGAACAACIAGERRCEGAVLRVCNAAGDGFDEQACASPAHCNQLDGVCIAPACAANEARCEGSVLLTCNSALTGFDSRECGSPPGCNPTLARCNFCAPNAMRCASGTSVAVCDASGQAEVTINCGLGESCSNGVCQLLGIIP